MEAESGHDSLALSLFAFRLHKVARHLLNNCVEARGSCFGRGVRSVDRRLPRVTGHSRRALSFFEPVDALFHFAWQAKHPQCAEIALAAGFAD